MPDHDIAPATDAALASSVVIGGPRLTPEQLQAVACGGARVEVDASVRERMRPAREWVDGLFADAGPGVPVYGINTGFGGLAGLGSFESVETAAELSRRLVLSTAAGTGRELDPEIVRGAMLLVCASIGQGRSGVPFEIVETLVAMLNAGVTPVVPEYGSLGASGDLIPLAHLALVATRDPAGEAIETSGEAWFGGRRMSGVEAMHAAGIERIVLGPKGGLAMIAGTGFSTTLAALALLDVELAVDAADMAAAMTVQAVTGFIDPFLSYIHDAREHPGQQESARRIREALAGSRFVDGAEDRDPVRLPPQDAYSIRCAPQVHGAARDVVAFARRTIEVELGAVTDNPLIVPELERPLKAISGGNFHAQPIAFASDFLAIAATDLASISERRLARLVDPALNRGLPPMLIPSKDVGLDCGFMMPQYLAAGLVSDCKTLAHPDSVDSIPSSANQEDHVSMAMNAGRHVRQVARNLLMVVALELHAGTQAIDLRVAQTDLTVADLSPRTRRIYDRIRAAVDFQTRDELLYPRLETMRSLVADGLAA